MNTNPNKPNPTIHAIAATMETLPLFDQILVNLYARWLRIRRRYFTRR
jgi:hypothetical protein